jgi:hypothetical protein
VTDDPIQFGPHVVIDQDALIASVDLVGRTGARDCQIGYIHDNVPAEQAGWYAHAQFTGTRIMVENHPGPLEAVQALALRLLTGAKCHHCGGLIALSDRGAVAYPGATMADGTLWTEAQIRKAGQCRWTRMGRRWVRGCEPK